MALVGEFVVFAAELFVEKAWLFDGNPGIVLGSENADPLLVRFDGVPVPGVVEVAGGFFCINPEVGVIGADEDGAVNFIGFGKTHRSDGA